MSIVLLTNLIPSLIVLIVKMAMSSPVLYQVGQYQVLRGLIVAAHCCQEHLTLGVVVLSTFASVVEERTENGKSKSRTRAETTL